MNFIKTFPNLIISLAISILLGLSPIPLPLVLLLAFTAGCLGAHLDKELLKARVKKNEQKEP